MATGEQVTIKTPDGEFMAYQNGEGPAIVVIQEIFGVNDVVRGIADDLARQGYFALAPDLFWRIEPGIRLTDKSDAEWKRAFELYNKFDVDGGVEDIQATLRTLRNVPGFAGRAGAAGYCLGGLLAYLTAARTDSDASVSFYGVGIQDRLGEAQAIRKPLLMHVAEKDQFVPAAAQERIQAGLSGHPQVTIHVYPGVDHAFARIGGAHYDKQAADLANGRTAAFFKQHLG